MLPRDSQEASHHGAVRSHEQLRTHAFTPAPHLTVADTTRKLFLFAMAEASALVSVGGSAAAPGPYANLCHLMTLSDVKEFVKEMEPLNAAWLSAKALKSDEKAAELLRQGGIVRGTPREGAVASTGAFRGSCVQRSRDDRAREGQRPHDR